MPTPNRMPSRRAFPVACILASALAIAPGAGHTGEFHAAWTSDFAAVLDGGVQRGARHLAVLELAHDGSFRLAGREVAVHASVLHTHGGGLSADLVGDLQSVSNIDADGATRVLEAWLEMPLGEAGSLRAGRYDLNSELDVIDAAGLFLHASHGIGPEVAQSGAVGPSIFPRTALGVRVHYDTGTGRTWRAAALDLATGSESGDARKPPFFDGPMFALEYARQRDGLHWRAGAWTFTRSRDSLAGADGRDRESGAYASVERRLAGPWVGYARIGFAREHVARIGRYVGAGLVHESGLLPNRDDALGLAVAHARNGAAYRAAMDAEGVATSASETAIELTWRVPVGKALVVQPDLQYVMDPGTDPDLRDALVVLLRVELRF